MQFGGQLTSFYKPILIRRLEVNDTYNKWIRCHTFPFHLVAYWSFEKNLTNIIMTLKMANTHKFAICHINFFFINSLCFTPHKTIKFISILFINFPIWEINAVDGLRGNTYGKMWSKISRIDIWNINFIMKKEIT